tara:strand:- start:4275 stop:4796 length:522 start_codon:yes stop_codon:yes gene_type:complete
MSEGGTVAMLFLVVFIFVVFTLIYFCLRRKKDAGYRQVLEGDELDEEELAFKRSLEEQNAEFGVDDELEFDDKELEQLRMLDEYREDIMKDDEEEGIVGKSDDDDNKKKQVEMTKLEEGNSSDNKKKSNKKNDGPNLKISLPDISNNSSPSLIKRHSPRITKKTMPPPGTAEV